MNNFFPSRWPILCAVMNGVSDLNLALAVHEAGAMPSLLLNRYNDDKTINYDLINDSLKNFQQSTGNVNLVFAISEEDLFDYQLVKILRQYKVSHIEFLSNYLDASHIWHRRDFQTAIKYIQTTTKIIGRTTKLIDNNLTDALGIKGKESAGFTGQHSVLEMFQQQQKLTPACALIPYGGIGTPEQVAYYINSGAVGIAAGTLFAASKESCLSEEVKLTMCKKTSSDLSNFSDTGQNALVLGNLETVLNDKSHWNREASLKSGIHGNGNEGHIYASKSIDYISEIRSVKEIVEYLTQLLH